MALSVSFTQALWDIYTDILKKIDNQALEKIL